MIAIPISHLILRKPANQITETADMSDLTDPITDSIKRPLE